MAFPYLPGSNTEAFKGLNVLIDSPVQQTKLVQALARMNGTTDRGNFVKFAVLARDGNVAFFRTRQAEMYSNLHKKGTPIERFVVVDTNAATRLSNGTNGRIARSAGEFIA